MDGLHSHTKTGLSLHVSVRLYPLIVQLIVEVLLHNSQHRLGSLQIANIGMQWIGLGVQSLLSHGPGRSMPTGCRIALQRQRKMRESTSGSDS